MIPVPDYTESGCGALAGCGEAAGMVSVLAERAASEGPRSTRAVETTPAAPLKVKIKMAREF